MVKKVKIKTSKNTLSVAAYLNSIEPASARKDAKTLAKLFKETTGVKPKMWGSSIVGYGEYTYYRANGDEGEFMACGFSSRKSGPTLYIMPGYKNYKDILDDLGPYKLGKSCLYLKNLKDIDLDIVAKLIKAGIKDLKKTHAVRINAMLQINRYMALSSALLIIAVSVCDVSAQTEDCQCCNENSRAFDFWLGEWSVTENGKAAGKNSIDKLQGDCVLRENWTSASGTFTGTSYNFYNSQKKQWQQLWLDNQGGSLELAGQRVGQQMIMSSQAQKNDKGQTVTHTITWTLNDDGSVRQLWETTTDKDTQRVFDGLYEK